MDICFASHRSPCVLHFIPSADETETTFFRLLRRDLVPFFRAKERVNEWLFSYHSLFMVILHRKYMFSVLPPCNLMIRLFLLLSEISMELTECFEMSLVLRPFKVLVFLVKVQWLHSSLDHHYHLLSRKTPYQDSSCLVRNFARCTRDRRSFQVFCDKRTGVGVSISATTLETWASSLCVTRIGANVASVIIEGMKG